MQHKLGLNFRVREYLMNRDNIQDFGMEQSVLFQG